MKHTETTNYNRNWKILKLKSSLMSQIKN